MTRELAELLVQVLTDAGLEAEVYEGYSGRGMYGSTTTGISTEASLPEILYAVINDAAVIAEAGLEGEMLNQDSLGLGNIIY